MSTYPPWCIEFVKKNWSNAITASKKYKMHPIIFLSHSAKETGWGSSPLAQNHNNYFGIMAAGKPNLYWKGQFYQSHEGAAKWRTYDKPLDSFLDYGRLISTSQYYKKAYSVSADPNKYAQEISVTPYMTDADGRAQYYKDFIWINNTIAQIAVKEQLKSTSSFGFVGLSVLITIGVLFLKNLRHV